MIAGLRPYPAMKDSSVPWLGEVPEHWEMRRIKTLFREKDERCGDGSGVLLSLTRAKGIVPQAEASNRIASAEDLSKYKVCSAGDLVMNRMQAWSGMFALSTYTGVVSPDYSVFGAIDRSKVKFFEHLFKTPIFVDQFAQRSKGIGSGFNRLYTPDFGAVPAVVPPLPEQVAIVRFLDYADRRIRRYIREKQKLIKLLEEQKQAIIHLAVTRGLDPNVRLKPSGVEWLGDVPEHWTVRRIKRLARASRKCFTDGDWIELPYITDHGVRLIQTGNVGTGEYREKGYRYVSERSFTDLRCTEARPGDVLICRLDGPVGRACLAPDLECRAITSVDNTILKVSADVDSRFVVYCLSSPVWLDWVQSLCRAGGGFRYRVSRSALGDFQLAIPSLPEQRQIADHLENSLRGIRDSIRRERGVIELIHEYRTRLIADVVTGKLDAREAAAKLPEEEDVVEPMEDVELLSDEEGSESADFDIELEEADA